MADETLDMSRGVYRRIYSGAITGKRINAVSPLAELCFWRLHMVADDFGNFIADPEMLVCAAFPRRVREVTPDVVFGCIQELIQVKLVRLYENGDEYGHIIGFCDRQPKSRNGRRIRRNPKPPWDDMTDEDIDITYKGNPGETGGNQGPGNPGANETQVDPSGRSHSDTEPEPEHHSHTDTDTESHPEQPPNQTGGNPEEEVEVDGSGTGSSGLVRTRYHGKILFESVMSPLVGWEDESRHPPKSAKYNRDLVCLNAWYNERVWPEGQDEIGQVRLAQVVEEAAKAPTMSKNPMAYMGNFTGKFVEEDLKLEQAKDAQLRKEIQEEGWPNQGQPSRKNF